MAGICLRIGCDLQQLGSRNSPRADLLKSEYSLRQCPCLVKNEGFCLRQGFQIAAAFDQHALPGRRADPSQKCNRNRHQQTAGAGRNQEDQPPVEPGLRVLAGKQHRRKEHGQQPQYGHNWTIKTGKPFRGALALALIFHGAFHHVQDLCSRGLLVHPGHPRLNQAVHVDAAAVDPAAHTDASGLKFPCQRFLVNIAAAPHDHRVHRDLLAGADHDDLPCS